MSILTISDFFFFFFLKNQGTKLGAIFVPNKGLD